jgi:hypothetical protein
LRRTEGKTAARFFHAARAGFFAADARRREKPDRHGLAEDFPWICHAAVRMERRLNDETIGALLCP